MDDSVNDVEVSRKINGMVDAGASQLVHGVNREASELLWEWVG